jgi:hypothetical protein
MRWQHFGRFLNKLIRSPCHQHKNNLLCCLPHKRQFKNFLRNQLLVNSSQHNDNLIESNVAATCAVNATASETEDPSSNPATFHELVSFFEANSTSFEPKAGMYSCIKSCLCVIEIMHVCNPNLNRGQFHFNRLFSIRQLLSQKVT